MTSRGIKNLLIETSLQTFADEKPNATNYSGVALTGAFLQCCENSVLA